MPTVETVRGPVDTADLGFTLPHEHIISGAHSVRINWPHTFDRDAEVAWALEKLEEAYDQGVRTLVDLTTFDLGRRVHAARSALV